MAGEMQPEPAIGFPGRCSSLLGIVLLIGCVAPGAVAYAGDAWPQWGGVHTDFRVPGAKIADHWPESGPKELWKRDLGDGYSSIVYDGDRLYTMYSRREKLEENKWAMDGKEVVVALDPATGETVWEFAYSVPWEEDMAMEFGPGPHSTPLVYRDRVFAVGCLAKLHCLDRKTGKLIWSKDLHAEYEASHLGRGYGASPLPYKDTIIIPIGGEGKSIIALKASDGSLAWKAQDFGPTYASPMLIEVDGQKQLVVFTGAEVSGLDPDDGSLLWTHPHPTQYGANISTPVWCDGNILVVSAAYGMGARGIHLKREGDKTVAEELWFSQKMRIQHGTAVASGDYLYGSSGDFGPAFLAAMNIRTGEMAWRDRRFSKANVLLAGDKLIILDEDGKLALAPAAPEELKVLAEFQLRDRNAWTVPTLVGDRLFVRDRKYIRALDLG